MEERTTATCYGTISNHATSSNQILWLFAVFGGMFMCKIAYELTAMISPLVFKGFIKLEDTKKLEWKNRGFSTFHAILVAIGSLYFLVISDLFDEHGNEEWIINRSSPYSDAILGMSIGYFLSDLAMILWTWPTLGGFEFILHHGLSMAAIVQALLSGQAQFYILIVLFTEITTPFVNLRWYLDVAGKKNSTLYVLDGIALFVGWLLGEMEGGSMDYNVSGLSVIGNHATSSKQILWLVSVFGGVLMCKICRTSDSLGFLICRVIDSEDIKELLAYLPAYEVTGVISPLFYKGFNKFNNTQKLEWKNRGFSTFHALFAAVGSLYFLVFSDVFDESNQKELIINRSSAPSDILLGMSIGYFFTDLAMIIWTYPTLGGFEYFFHHGLSLFAIIQSLISGQVQFYILIVLFTEITTPFVNLRWYLDVANKKTSALYMLNGLAMFVGWLFARIILFIYFFYHIYTHFDQKNLGWPLTGSEDPFRVYFSGEASLLSDGILHLVDDSTGISIDESALMSIGYFFTDLAMIIWTYPTLGGVEYFFHHGLSLFAIIQSLISGQVQFYILIVLFTEITTPFVNLRWYLDVANKKTSALYMLNGLAMFVGWLFARIILFIYFFYHIYTHFDQKNLGWPLTGSEDPFRVHFSGEASLLSDGILHLVDDSTGISIDESALVLEDH
ncbi:TRAM/LAG1/CLN8-like domain-containing protein [Artemisia annua]|uniref:TRAM/LAG1/CLN8-like domain-containing protein n=1 Tax=Artemisia annua TaxID=35608 RepID=A0A2U1NAT1_ARTAN|nr:TRAM/LAG1/CLN8-like domain-containing protein [Artemisia annua]